MMMVLLTNPDGTEQTRVHVADSYPGYEGWTVGTPEEWPTLDMQKDVVWANVKALREQHKSAGCTIPGVGTVQTDEVSTQNINGLVTMAQIAISQSMSFSEPFTMADNTVVTFDAPGMIDMGVAVAQYIAAVYARARDLRTAIYTTDITVDELNAIDIETGWP